ncbi:MAG: hypothetical protein AUG08_10210 [Acidobacteria bacterium 13_1_20CM_2_55_15]|nr:MAG: hypothetical protein AUG08_10210 [Acidobacteria bacterium 13_1_20CM_2_55_15]
MELDKKLLAYDCTNITRGFAMLIFVLLTTIFTANDLKQYCAGSARTDQAFCIGYLRGFEEGLNLATAATGNPQDFERLSGCRLNGVTLAQTRLVFLKYIDDHPEQLHWEAFIVFSNAMLAAFPCHSEKGEH